MKKHLDNLKMNCKIQIYILKMNHKIYANPDVNYQISIKYYLNLNEYICPKLENDITNVMIKKMVDET